MAQTLGQFIEECELFEYSKEYYELVKECSELALMERYIENQEFITECVDASVYTEGYFMEADSEESNTTVKKSFGEKAKDLGNKIIKFFKTLIPKLISALTKFKNLFDETTRSANAIYNDLKKNGVSKETSDLIIELYHTQIDKDDKTNDAGFELHKNQPFEAKIALDKSITSDRAKDTIMILSGSLSNTSVRVKQKSKTKDYNRKNKTIGAVPIKTISKVCKELTNPKNKSYDYSGSIHTLEQAYQDVKTNGFEITVNSKELDKIIKELQEMNTRLTIMSGQTEYDRDNIVRNAAGPAIADHEASIYNIKIDGINKINACVASTLTIYSSYATYRKKFISGMSKYFVNKAANIMENE